MRGRSGFLPVEAFSLRPKRASWRMMRTFREGKGSHVRMSCVLHFVKIYRTCSTCRSLESRCYALYYLNTYHPISIKLQRFIPRAILDCNIASPTSSPLYVDLRCFFALASEGTEMLAKGIAAFLFNLELDFDESDLLTDGALLEAVCD